MGRCLGRGFEEKDTSKWECVSFLSMNVPVHFLVVFFSLFPSGPSDKIYLVARDIITASAGGAFGKKGVKVVCKK